MPICLPKEKVDKLKEDFKTYKIDIEKLLTMPTEERFKVFEQYAGNDAKTVNLLFEKKLVLKNKMRGLVNLMSKLTETGRYDPNKKAEIEKALKEFKDKQTERIFNPKEEETFLGELAETVLGTRVTREEAKVIFNIDRGAEAILKKGYNPKTQTWTSKKEEMEYGMQKAILRDYVNSLKDNDLPLKEILKGRYSEFQQQLKDRKYTAVLNVIKDTAGAINDISISLVATVDNSFQFRQGFKVLVNHPGVWKKGFNKSWSDMYQTLKGNGVDVRNVLWAEIYSNPNYIEGRYQKMKILPESEEQYPTSIPERIPFLGRVLTASERAFVGSALRMRTGVADIILEMQKKNGVNIDDPKILKKTGEFVNSLTARGRWSEKSELNSLRLVLWAPKMLKSALDTFYHPFKPDLAPGIRKQAVFNLLRVIGTLATIKTLATIFNPDEQEWDPRATDFASVKFGNTRFKIGVGELSLLTLASRSIPTLHNGEWGFWYKNNAGVYTKFKGEYGQRSPLDLVIDFLTNKTTPTARALISYMEGKNFRGEKPTWASTVTGLATPISIQNVIQLGDDHSANAVLGAMLDTIGVGGTTYSSMEKDWNMDLGKELKQFKKKVGEEKFKEANEKYNTLMNEWWDKTKNSKKFNKLSDEEKVAEITKQRRKTKDKIFSRY